MTDKELVFFIIMLILGVVIFKSLISFPITAFIYYLIKTT